MSTDSELEQEQMSSGLPYHGQVWVLINEISQECHLLVEVLGPDFSDDGSFVWTGH